MCTTCGCSGTQGATVTDPDEAEREPATQEGGAEHQHGDEPARGYRRVQAQSHMHSHLHAHSHDHEHPHEHPQEHGHEHPHEHAHPHDHPHGHVHDHEHASTTPTALDPAHTHAREHGTAITLEQDILAKNQLLAERNRGWLAGRSILAVNLMSSPGAGKTTLLERTIRDLGESLPLTVIEGDQATLNDAQRIRATGCRVIQINTGTGCHLDAGMISRGLTQLDPPSHSVVMIENVGNLVCPALFDLGEQAKVLILAVTEGEDKPVKYPHMFRASSLMLLNKIDLLPHLRFDVARCIEYARRVNPAIEILQVSAQTGEGMDAWYAWLRSHGDAYC
jgi:hydrogenase nickel incorporation protein HypB